MAQPINALAGYWLDGALRGLEGLRTGLNSTVNDPPPVTPYRVVFESGKLRLRHYAAAGKAHRTPILLVYALIKRPFVLDIQKGRSVIEYLTRAGFDVFLTDWLPPNAADTWRGFDAYVNGDLHAALRAARVFTQRDQVTILGYCFGGLLSLAYTALHPEGVRNLITATTPFDLGASELPVYNLVERMSDEAIELIA
jgi:polyhydroxyalkanoate synthase